MIPRVHFASKSTGRRTAPECTSSNQPPSRRPSGTSQERKIPEFEDKDTLIDYFFTLWKEVKTTWRDLWVAESKLLSKVGIVCMTQYVTNSVASSYDLAQLDITNWTLAKREEKQS